MKMGKNCIAMVIKVAEWGQIVAMRKRKGGKRRFFCSNENKLLYL